MFRKDILFVSDSVNFKTHKSGYKCSWWFVFQKPTRTDPEDVADESITDAKALMFNKHIRKSFNGLDYEARSCSMSISLNTQGNTTIREEQKNAKQKKSNQLKKNTSYSLREKATNNYLTQQSSSMWKSKLQNQLENILVLNHHNQSLNNNNSVNC